MADRRSWANEWDERVRLAAIDGETVEPEGGRPNGSKPPLKWFREIEPALDAGDFVQGLLVKQSAIVVYGQSNSGKTFWITDLALHVAAGRPWCGRRVEQGGVFYCVLEGGNGFLNRVAAWRDEHGMRGVDLPFVSLSYPLNLLKPELGSGSLINDVKGAAALMGMPIKLIVIDTLARAMAGGNENASEDMGALVASMDDIRSKTKAAVLFVHHSGKDQARGGRGHSSLQAAVDTEIEVVEDAEAGTRHATVVKQRELRKGDVFPFALRVIDLGYNRHGEMVTTCIVDAEAGAAEHTKSPADKLSGANRRSLDLLNEACASGGVKGRIGVPPGFVAVSEDDWRETFYSRAMPGASAEAKRKAFRRAADSLIQLQIVGMGGGYVWSATN